MRTQTISLGPYVFIIYREHGLFTMKILLVLYCCLYNQRNGYIMKPSNDGCGLTYIAKHANYFLRFSPAGFSGTGIQLVLTGYRAACNDPRLPKTEHYNSVSIEHRGLLPFQDRKFDVVRFLL